LFRGLFINRFTILFGAVVANLLQSVVFTAAHLGVGYTLAALLKTWEAPDEVYELILVEIGNGMSDDWTQAAPPQ